MVGGDASNVSGMLVDSPGPNPPPYEKLAVVGRTLCTSTFQLTGTDAVAFTKIWLLFASTLTATVPHTFNAEHDLIVTVAVVMSSSCENDFSVPSKIEGVDETDTMPSFSSDVSEAIPVCIVTKNDTLSFK